MEIFLQSLSVTFQMILSYPEFLCLKYKLYKLPI